MGRPGALQRAETRLYDHRDLPESALRERLSRLPQSGWTGEDAPLCAARFAGRIHAPNDAGGEAEFLWRQREVDAQLLRQGREPLARRGERAALTHLAKVINGKLLNGK